MSNTYTGSLSRQSDGTYSGCLRDPFGFSILLTATVVERDGQRLFDLVGQLGPIPEPYFIPGLDEA